MVGSVRVRRLVREDFDILTAGRDELDIRGSKATSSWLAEERRTNAFLAAATVGGISANDTRLAEFIYDNPSIETNRARRIGVEKLTFLGPSSIYA